MIIDLLKNASRYYNLGPDFVKAFKYLRETDFSGLGKGKYEIEGTKIFAIINEYNTVAAAGEQLESHKRYIDVQYVVEGEELIGHHWLQDQTPSKAYDAEADFMLFGEAPAFFSKLQQGQFAIFFPSDLHMPNLKIKEPQRVKKVVIKIATGL